MPARESPSLLPLALITLVFNLGGGVIAPALPLYARSLGADYRDLGLIGASHGLAFAALTIPLGRASDRFGRRAILLLSTLAVGTAAIGYLLAAHVLALAAAKFLEAIGWAAFWPALEAWAAEQFGHRAGAAMGVGYGAYAAAFVIGTSAAGFVIEAAGLRAPFAIYVGTAAAAVVLILALSGRGAREPSASEETRRGPRLAPVDPTMARAQRLLAYGTGFVYVYGLGTVLAFLPAHAADRGLSPRSVGLLFGGYWVARLVGSLGAGRVSDLLGRRAVLLPALLVAAVSAGLVAVPGAIAALVVGSMGLGLAAGACAPACVGLVADYVSAADRGLAMGLFEASCGVSILISGLVGGYSAQALGAEAPYLVVAGLALAWTIVLARRLAPPPASLLRS